HKDPDDPTSPLLWEDFNYELACAELCGKSHYSMRRIVRIVSEDEYNAWLAKQQSYYINSIRNKEKDPNRGKLLEFEIKQNKDDLGISFERALGLEQFTRDSVSAGADSTGAAPVVEDVKGDVKLIRLDAVQFEIGNAVLTPDSEYQLTDLAELMKKYLRVRIEISGHTDNEGEAATNTTLSQKRAEAAKNFLVKQGVEPGRIVAIGYGSVRPADTNDTDAGRQKNRRIEIRITAQ
ncbi:MAG: OmpA family protein, partial [Bacteroidota bacterium]|nr:OmpA family protein [Bacteroidota bacterium]